MLSEFGELVDGIFYLLKKDLIFLNDFLIDVYTPNEKKGVLKENELESSLARPGHVRYYEQTEDMYRLASTLIETLIKNHPFHNANKRTAAAAGCIFLLLNGYELTAPEDDLVEIMLGIATNRYDVKDLENWIALWARPFETRIFCVPIDKLQDILEMSGIRFNPFSNC